MGQLRADADAHQMAFEIHGLILALHYEARFLKIPRLHRTCQHGVRQHPFPLQA
jgi:hypothetical protein